jgi:hypothetical protein
MVATIFLIVAVVLFVMQGVGVTLGRVSPGWIGLAFFAGSFLF